MTFLTRYPSPVGMLLLASDGENLTGLWLEGQRHYAAGLEADAQYMDSLPLFRRVKRWLDRYFAGEAPAGGELPVKPAGTDFRRAVCALLTEIPYGQTVTYGELARRYTLRTGRRTSARAVGGAVGRNPVSIVIPCHRVVGAGGALVGFAAGLDHKRFLLELERSK